MIEIIPFIYELFAPLTLSYHFTLVTNGIFHIGTIIYIFVLPLSIYYSRNITYDDQK